MIDAELKVFRFPSEIDWTLSEYSLLGVKLGVGVEDEYRAVKKHGETRIPNGIYEIDFTNSPKFSGSYFVDANGNLSKEQDARFTVPHLMITVMNVPGFSRILWHWGNSEKDTDGCYCVGSYFSKTAPGQVAESRNNYVKAYPKIYQLWRSNKAAGKKTYVQYMDRDLAA